MIGNATGGGNKVIVVENTQDLVSVSLKIQRIRYETEYGAKLVQDDLQDYFASHQQWASENAKY